MIPLLETCNTVPRLCRKYVLTWVSTQNINFNALQIDPSGTNNHIKRLPWKTFWKFSEQHQKRQVAEYMSNTTHIQNVGLACRCYGHILTICTPPTMKHHSLIRKIVWCLLRCLKTCWCPRASLGMHCCLDRTLQRKPICIHCVLKMIQAPDIVRMQRQRMEQARVLDSVLKEQSHEAAKKHVNRLTRLRNQRQQDKQDTLAHIDELHSTNDGGFNVISGWIRFWQSLQERSRLAHHLFSDIASTFVQSTRPFSEQVKSRSRFASSYLASAKPEAHSYEAGLLVSDEFDGSYELFQFEF